MRMVLFALAVVCATGALAAGEKIKVACIGDSITWGYAMTNRVEECYPTRLQELLGSEYEVGNFGDPGAGAYTRQFKEKSYRLRDKYGPAVAFGADIVVCNLGINDEKGYLDEYVHDGTGTFKIAPGTFREDYIDLLESFAKGGKRPRYIIWTKLAPLDARHREKSSPGPFVMERDLEAVAKAVGAETMDLFTPLRKYMNGPHFVADGVHPEGEVQREIARLTAERIRKGSSETKLTGRAERDNWGVPTSFGMKGSPTVVNPPVRAPENEIFSLNGEWEILADERSIPWGAKPFAQGGLPGDPGCCGTYLGSEADWQKFLKVGAYHGGGVGKTRKVRIPGFWEPQGIGVERVGRTWDSPDRGEFLFKHAFSGVALLRRTFDAPASWTGRQLWFKVGGVQGLAYFWINGRPAALVRQSCGSYKFNVTGLVTPGKPFSVVAYVQADGPSKFGCWNALHHMSGFYRGLEIETTDGVWLDDVWCRGDVRRKEAEVHVSLRGVAQGERLRVTATLGGNSVEKEMAAGEDGVLRLPLPGGRLWSPESPNLHTARVTVVRGNRTVGAWHERFGVRELAVRDGQFFLNGRPFFVRGCGNHGRDALTHIAEADRTELGRRIGLMRRAGFNQSRHHTHCPYPEYFDAADELGLLVQPELPYACGGPCEAIPYAPLFDAKEYVRHLRRHPSFAILSLGNEGHMASCDREVYEWMKANDPDRLVLHNDGGRNTPENSDFSTGPAWEWREPQTSRRRPFVAHEYLNLGIKEDPRDAARYTGLLGAPRTWEQFDGELARAGLTRSWGLRCTDASQRLQAYYEKRGIEAARSDPFCSGYSFWAISDAGASTTGPSVAQGYFNAFWEPKRAGLSPEEFARFNGPDVLLLKPADPSPILVSGSRSAADVLLAAYGERDHSGTTVAWRLVAGGSVLAEGESAVSGRTGVGAARKIATLSLDVPPVAAAVHAKLELSFDGVTNTWDRWVFPKRERKDGSMLAVHPSFASAFTNLYDKVAVLGTAAAAGRPLRVLTWTPDAPAAEKGQRTLFVSQTDGAANVSLGWWWIGDQVGTAFADHPALAGLPHDGFLSPLFFRLVKRGRPLPFAPVPPEKLIAVGEGRDGYFCYLGGDRMTLYAFGLDVLSGHPEATFLLDGMIGYCLSKESNGL